jgi:hypothetical protein
MTTWILVIILVAGGDAAGQRIGMSTAVTHIDGYSSQEACERAVSALGKIPTYAVCIPHS